LNRRNDMSEPSQIAKDASKNFELDHYGDWPGDDIAAVKFQQAIDAAMAEERELRIMQLAAISTAAIQNTETTIKDRIGSDNPYYSTAYVDTCRAVDREMEHRAEIERLKKEVQPTWMHTCLHHTDEERLKAFRCCPCCILKDNHRLEETLIQRDQRIDQLLHQMTDQEKFEENEINQRAADTKAMVKAVQMWQRETSNPGVIPHPSVLLWWLMEAMETPRIREMEKRLDWEQKNAEKLAIRLQALEEIVKTVQHTPAPAHSLATCPACRFQKWRDNP